MKHGITKFTLLAGVLLSSLAVSAFALLTAPTTASTEGTVVVRGLESGESNLKLAASGGNLVVNGPMELGGQVGCVFTEGHKALRCPLAGIGRIEVIMGLADDTVEVLEPLPVPLTVHLGKGSDKFIGNAEPDTCYPEGDANNSCDGGGGNDVCVTASETTKCIGGPGDDVCKAGGPNNACYGGPGNDVCKMGVGEDKCLGEAGNDRLFGGSGSDNLSGGPGNDQVNGQADSDKLYGDVGNDRLNGGPSPDKVYGGPGDDRLNGGPSPDKLYGQAGRDFCKGAPGIGRSYSCEIGPGR